MRPGPEALPDLGAAPPSAAPRFYHEPWVVALLVALLPPLGLLALVSTPELSRRAKAGVAALLGLVLLALVGLEGSDGALSGALVELWAAGHHRAAVGFLRAGHLDAALASASRASELAPEDPDIYRVLAQVHFERGDTHRRLLALELAARDEDHELREDASPRLLVLLGRAYLDEGQLERVEEVLAELDDLKGKRAGAPALRAGWLTSKGRPREALETARRLIDDFYVQFFGEAYWEMARAQAARGEWLSAAYFGLEGVRHGPPLRTEEARKQVLAWAESAGVAPEPVQAFLKAIELRGPFDGRQPADEEGAEVADRLLEQLLERHPAFWAADLVLHTRGSFFFYQEENWDRAEAMYRQVVERYPRAETRCRCLYQLARTHRKAERFDAAVRYAQLCIAECPGSLADSSRVELRRARRDRARSEADDDDDEADAQDES